MADNFNAKDAAGSTVAFASDDIASVQYPRHKLSLGADGAAADAVGGSGVVGSGVQRVVLATDVPLPAGTNNLGGVGVLTQVGAANLANSQATADTTAGGVLLVASRATRRAVTIVNLGTTAVYLGVGSVTTSNGFLLPGVAGAAVTINTTAAVKGVVASGSQAVGVLEEYD